MSEVDGSPEVRSEPKTVQVSCVEEEDVLTLEFSVRGREHRLQRYKQESLRKALHRIALTVCKDEKGKSHVSRRRRVVVAQADADSVDVRVYCGGEEAGLAQEVPPDRPNLEAWVAGNTLVLDHIHYSIEVNTPRVKSLRLPLCICGYAVSPEVELVFADAESCEWVWQCCASRQVSMASHSKEVAPFVWDRLTASPVVCTSRVYHVTQQDYQHHLLLECTPKDAMGRKGKTVKVTSEKVSQCLRNVPIEERHLQTPYYLTESDRYRVVTYNILASFYASTDYAREHLYPYCSYNALHIEYRQCLLARELLGYHADVICLQEVGQWCFLQYLSPVLRQSGFGGCYHGKAGQIKEGEAMFYNTSKFLLISEDAVVLREFVLKDPSCRHILSLHPLVLNNLLKRHNILQVVFLEDRAFPGRYLCVANTHLFYHPMGDHIRLLQVEIALKYIEGAVQLFRQRDGVGGNSQIAIMLMGDFNSCPCIAAYNYILDGVVPREHWDWQVCRMDRPPLCSCDHKSLNIIREDGEHQLDFKGFDENEFKNDELIVGLDLKHGLHFTNATGTTHATNITLSWKGVLDYIFIDSERLKVDRVIPLPSDEQLTESVALPSIYFPSDHVALGVDVVWK